MKMITLFLITSLAVSLCLADTAEVPMSFSGNDSYPNSRLWLPCSAGICMIDLAGAGTAINVSSYSSKLQVIKPQKISTLQGPKDCDLVSVPTFNLAGKDFSSIQFTRCDWFPADNSPMLGGNFFRTTPFYLHFSTSTFSWLSDGYAKIGSSAVTMAAQGPWWFSFTSKIGSVPVKSILDSGAPLTLVDTAFYKAHPELFTPSTTVPDEADLKAPLSINGQIFTNTRVEIADLKTQFTVNAPDIFIGMNHLHQADWIVDIPHLQLYLDLLP